MTEKKVLSNREKTREMTLLAMFIAIIAVLGLVPAPWGTTFGFFRIYGQVEATIIHIPVLIGAALFGRKYGLWLGIAFGVVSNIAAFIYNPYFFIYPWVAILPRFLFGILIVPVVNFFLKIIKNKYISLGVSFFLLTLIHAVMTLTMLYTVFNMVLNANGVDHEATLVFYFGWLALNAGVPWITLGEAAAAAIIGSIVVMRLAGFRKISKYVGNEGDKVESSN